MSQGTLSLSSFRESVPIQPSRLLMEGLSQTCRVSSHDELDLGALRLYSEEGKRKPRICGLLLSQEIQIRVSAGACIDHEGKVSRKVIRIPARNQRKGKWQF